VVVIDASVAAAICSKEALFEPVALAALSHYETDGYLFYSPGVIAAEVLYVLCRKLQDGFLDAVSYGESLVDLTSLLRSTLSMPYGDASLIQRAAAIRGSYTCKRSSDSLYIALAELLPQTRSTVLLTFDKELPKQAAANAPSVNVHFLTI
jgi:predicted nucleic acid-binding protein